MSALDRICAAGGIRRGRKRLSRDGLSCNLHSPELSRWLESALMERVWGHEETARAYVLRVHGRPGLRREDRMAAAVRVLEAGG